MTSLVFFLFSEKIWLDIHVICLLSKQFTWNVKPYLFWKKFPVKVHTVFNLITAHTPISTQSSNSVVFRCQCIFVYFFIKACVVGTHLNCIYLSIQFKCVPTTYAFIKKISKKKKQQHTKTSHKHYLISPSQSFVVFFLKSTFSIGRYIFYHKFFPAFLRTVQ